MSLFLMYKGTVLIHKKHGYISHLSLTEDLVQGLNEFNNNLHMQVWCTEKDAH